MTKGRSRALDQTGGAGFSCCLCRLVIGIVGLRWTFQRRRRKSVSGVQLASARLPQPTKSQPEPRSFLGYDLSLKPATRRRGLLRSPVQPDPACFCPPMPDPSAPVRRVAHRGLPGEQALTNYANALCLNQFQPYVGSAYTGGLALLHVPLPLAPQLGRFDQARPGNRVYPAHDRRPTDPFRGGIRSSS